MILTFFETKDGLIKKSSLILADYCKRLKNKFNLNITGIVSNEINETEEEKLNPITKKSIFIAVGGL